ncbi:MAG: hypothetical protein K1X74_04440 [Pirellulales bacterium]|nr:hypothetical protein [Pirellulales bacterium]
MPTYPLLSAYNRSAASADDLAARRRADVTTGHLLLTQGSLREFFCRLCWIFLY